MEQKFDVVLKTPYSSSRRSTTRLRVVVSGDTCGVVTVCATFRRPSVELFSVSFSATEQSEPVIV